MFDLRGNMNRAYSGSALSNQDRMVSEKSLELGELGRHKKMGKIKSAWEDGSDDEEDFVIKSISETPQARAQKRRKARAKKFAEKMIDNEMVQFVGSDCHNLKHLNTLEKALDTPYFAKLSKCDLKNNIV